jgi:general secretion pathway protein B
MSLLLDALNKADQERKRNEATPGINSNHENIHDHGARNKSIALIAAVIFGFAILLGAICWLGQRSAAPAATANPPTTSSAQAQQQKSVATSTSAPAQEPITPVQEVDASEDNVASLYQQNTQAQNPNATLTLSTPPADVSVPVPVPAITSADNEQPAAAPISINQFANLPDLHDLPAQVLEKIPSLNYSEHNYNNNGGSVKINGNIHHANEQLAGDVVIDKILEDGMILHVGNYAFKMRALNSWINM